MIGIVIVLIGLAYALHMLATLVVPTLFAVLLGATFLPVVDWLERHHVGRTWGALIVTVLVVVGGFALLALMTVGIIQQWPTIEHQIEAAVDLDQRRLCEAWTSTRTSSTRPRRRSPAAWAAGPRASSAARWQGISTLATFAFAAFIGLNILVYVLIGGRRIGRWTSEHMGPVPSAGRLLDPRQQRPVPARLHLGQHAHRRLQRGRGRRRRARHRRAAGVHDLRGPVAHQLHPDVRGVHRRAFAVLIALGTGGVRTPSGC